MNTLKKVALTLAASSIIGTAAETGYAIQQNQKAEAADFVKGAAAGAWIGLGLLTAAAGTKRAISAIEFANAERARQRDEADRQEALAYYQNLYPGQSEAELKQRMQDDRSQALIEFFTVGTMTGRPIDMA